jgi:hypothetical protein
LAACQEELAACQEDLKSEISGINADQGEFEIRIINMLDKQLKGIMTVINRWTRKLCEEICSEV